VDRPWSVRFIQFAGGAVAAWVYWIVPAGFRAIVTDWAVYQSLAGSQSCFVSVNGYIVAQLTPGAIGSRVATMRVVAYQGEQVGVYQPATHFQQTLCGYLLTDVGGPPRALEPSPPGPGLDSPLDDPSGDPRGLGGPRLGNRPGRRPAAQEAA
jgi:hypothetical protein